VSHDSEIAAAFGRLYEAEQARDAASGDLVRLGVIRSYQPQPVLLPQLEHV
jgi:hypothetical protein